MILQELINHLLELDMSVDVDIIEGYLNFSELFDIPNVPKFTKLEMEKLDYQVMLNRKENLNILTKENCKDLESAWKRIYKVAMDEGKAFYISDIFKVARNGGKVFSIPDIFDYTLPKEIIRSEKEQDPVTFKSDISNLELPEELYINYLENMTILLSTVFQSLVQCADEEALKHADLPQSDDARRAIRMIAADAIAEHKDIGSENMQICTQKLIDKHKKS